MNSEDWAKIWGPLMAAAIPEIVKAIPQLIGAIVGWFTSLSAPEQANVLNKVVGYLPDKRNV